MDPLICIGFKTFFTVDAFENSVICHSALQWAILGQWQMSFRLMKSPNQLILMTLGQGQMLGLTMLTPLLVERLRVVVPPRAQTVINYVTDDPKN